MVLKNHSLPYNYLSSLQSPVNLSTSENKPRRKKETSKTLKNCGIENSDPWVMMIAVVKKHNIVSVKPSQG